MLRVLGLCLVILTPASGQALTIPNVLPGAELRGEAVLRLFGFPLYRARLYTETGAPLNWDQDFGLELTYMRDLSRQDLAESTMRELERIGGAIPIRDQLNRCYADVRRGDRIAAVSQGQNQIAFWLNGTRTCTLSHPQIKSRFMAIFLGDNTRSRSFTRKLKGE
ncbi:chalcone isomerase family protein [Sedimentitalea todarodis]|uniref:Chalcone isomerase family protein n=1 Tax=Sedimentitalea todarodis TaxID=1631240 RepID=A0ABU3VGQ9_9RHOB|nr:chalcone isomerase family protein [Sedimentitalea todarodis]MDU9005364.1 chalcone isomerase family protein [Sedimentitalea todarodis]